jgi:uncharacterized protein (TIGR02217 family)
MAFLDVRFPECFSYGAQFGPMFKTDVVVVNSGYESRNRIWQFARIMADVSQNVKTVEDFAQIQAFFNLAAGRANAFRVKDWTDFLAAAPAGRLGTGAGDGGPTYQLVKRYTTAAQNYDRPITRPVSGQVAVTRNASPVTIGSGDGNIAIDYSTGIVTFVRDAQSGATSITPGATTTVILTTNPGTLTAGQRLYLSGFTGSGAALVNNIAHAINSVTGTGPFTFVLATNTSGATITLGSGIGRKFPQTTEALAWTGQFDVPMRFDTDQLVGQIIAPGLYSWSSIPLVEVRDENN